MAEHRIEVSISAVDKASSVISKTKSNVESLTNSIRRVGKVRVNGDGLKDVANEAQKGRTQVNSLNNSVNGLGNSLSRLKGLIAGAFSVTAIAGFGKSAMEASADMELLQKGLSFTLGVEQTNRLIKNIQQIGEQSAYDSNDLIVMARQWVNIGDNAETATKKISTIVDAGSAYGLTKEQIEGANLALTQMSMSGKIGAQDMMQLINAGIPAWQLLSDKMGIPVAELKDMSRTGELAGDAINTLFDALGERTKDATAGMNNTLSAAFSNLGETAHNTMASVGDIIAQAFDVKGVSSKLSDSLGTVRQDLTYIKNLSQTMGLRKAFEEEYGPIAKVIELLGDLAAAYAAVKAAQLACAAAQAAFNAVTNANPLVSALTVTIGLLILVYQHFDEIKEIAGSVASTIKNKCDEVADFFSGLGSSILNAVHSAVKGIEDAFSAVVNKVKDMWNGLVDFVSHPISTTLKVVRNITDTVTGSSGRPSAKGGVFGGLVPLANGGTLKHGTPAIVGEAGPEAVIPLRKDVLAQIGAGIAQAYKNGMSSGTRSSDISAKIKAEVDAGNSSEINKILDDAKKKAQAVGEQLKSFREYEEQANEKAKEYADTGSATIEFKEREAELEKKIYDLQHDKKGRDNSTKIAATQSKLEETRNKYEQEKNEAIAAAQDAADNRENIEKEASDAIVAIRKQAIDKVSSYQRVKDEAKNAEERANNAESLAEYQKIMAEKAEMTDQSYASILAHENELGEQRQIWHDQMMINAASWSDYMQTVMLQIGQDLTTNLSEGLTNVLMGAKSIGEAFGEIAKTILQTLINGALKKLLSSVLNVGTQTTANAAKETASITSTTAALAAKAAAEAKVAAASLIAANPFGAAGAGAMVATQMAIASAGSAVAKMANGGPVFGAGTSTSDSIPAMLSNGEYVINADAASAIGRSTLNALNSGRYPAFADGGGVGSTSAGQTGNSVNLNVSAMDASSFMDFLRNGGMDSIKQMLFDGNRDFTMESGVW